jgi:hypothetical protein
LRNVIMVLCALAIAAAAGAQGVKSPQKPGKWQIRMEMEMPGMPMKMPPVTTEVCLTEADLEDPQKAVPKDAKSDCKVSDYKVVGNTVTWAMECPSQKMKGTGEATYAGDTYTAAMKMEMGEQKMSMKHSGKWLGTCSK